MDYGVSCPLAYEKNKTNRLIIDKTISSHFLQYFFLAHLSQRLIGELIVYPWSGIRRRRLSVIHNYETSSSPKLLGLSKPNFIRSILG